MDVLVPLAKGLEEIEAVTIIDVLRRGGLKVVTAALGEKPGVMGAHDIAVLADMTLDGVTSGAFKALVLPGGGPGTERLMADERVLGMVREFYGSGRVVAAICAAPMVLARAGILADGVRATCYPACADALGAAYDDAAPVVADRNVITSRGPGTAMLFALVVLQHLAGEAVAAEVAKGMLFPFPGA